VNGTAEGSVVLSHASEALQWPEPVSDQRHKYHQIATATMLGIDPLPFVARGGDKAARYFKYDLWWFLLIQQPRYILTYVSAAVKAVIVVVFQLWPTATEECVVRFVEGTTLGACISLLVSLVPSCRTPLNCVFTVSLLCAMTSHPYAGALEGTPPPCFLRAIFFMV
jgi:hypothetical protein